MAKPLSEGEKRFIDDTAATTGDEVVFSVWLKKQKRDKIQDRLLVVGKYRIYSIKRNKVTGKKQVQRQGHMFELKELYSTEIDKLVIKFADFYIDVTSERAPEITKIIRCALQKAAFTFPESALPRLAIIPPDRVLPLDPLDPGPAFGFLETYKAYCCLKEGSLAPSKYLESFILDITSQGIRDLVLSDCPGIEPKSEYVFDLWPLFRALQHNIYFVSLVLKNVKRIDAVQLSAQTMSGNKTIQNLVLSGLQASEGFAELGDALKKNPENVLTRLDISNNMAGNKGIQGLADGLGTFRHPLVYLNVSNNSIQGRGIQPLMQQLQENATISSSLMELDLSQNKIEAAGTAGITNFFQALKDRGVLRTLNLSETQVDISSICFALRAGCCNTLVELDLSQNKIDKGAATALGSFLEASPCMEKLNISNCKMAGDTLATIINSLFTNTNIKAVQIDASCNELGDDGVLQLSDAIRRATNLHTLILRQNAYKKQGLVTIIDSIAENKSLQCVDLGLNQKPPNEKETKKKGVVTVSQAIADLLKKNTLLNTLYIAGDGEKKCLGKFIDPLYDALANNRTLTRLNITGNRIGDEAGTLLANSLKNNVTLQSMMWDNNGISVGGWQALRNALNNNRTLCEVPIPTVDVAKCVSSKDQRFKDKVNALWQDITAVLEANKNPSAPRPMQRTMSLISSSSFTMASSPMGTPSPPSSLGSSGSFSNSFTPPPQMAAPPPPMMAAPPPPMMAPPAPPSFGSTSPPSSFGSNPSPPSSGLPVSPPSFGSEFGLPPPMTAPPPPMMAPPPPPFGAPPPPLGAPPSLSAPPPLGAPPMMAAPPPMMAPPPAFGAPPPLSAPPPFGAPPPPFGAPPPPLGAPPPLSAPPLSAPPPLGMPPPLSTPPPLGIPPPLSY